MTINNVQVQESTWIKEVQVKFQNNNSGFFKGEKPTDNSIIIEWEKLTSSSSDFNKKIKDLSKILIDTYANQELEFAQQCPKEVQNEFFLKSLSGEINDSNNINWNLVKEKIKQTLQEFFDKTDFSKFSKSDDIHLFVTTKEKDTGNILGFIQFLISTEFDYANVKIGYFGVADSKYKDEIQQMLISSIFKLIPENQRIFLHTRKTNINMIKSYKSLGFEKFQGPLPNWVDLEYKAKKSDILQKIAKQLK